MLFLLEKGFHHHSHHDVEINYILEGEMFDNGEVRYGPGDFIRKEKGDKHHYTVGEDCDLLVVAIHNGFDIVM